MVQGENSRRARTVGIYPETKHPSFHAALGLAQEHTLLNILERFGWNDRNSPVFIQSFETGNLQYLRKLAKVRLVQLIDADDVTAVVELALLTVCDSVFEVLARKSPVPA